MTAIELMVAAQQGSAITRAMPAAKPSVKPVAATADGPPIRKRGRPLGSKNKPKPAPTGQATPTPTRKQARLVCNTSSSANSNSANTSSAGNSSGDDSNNDDGKVAGCKKSAVGVVGKARAAAGVAGRTRSAYGVAGQTGAAARVAGRTKSANGVFDLAKAAAWVTAMHASLSVSVSKRGHLVTGRASVGDLTWALQSVKLARLYGDLLAKPATVFVSAVVPGLGPSTAIFDVCHALMTMLHAERMQAPDDEALRKYSAAHPGAEALLPTEELRNIIANHIIPGKVGHGLWGVGCEHARREGPTYVLAAAGKLTPGAMGDGQSAAPSMHLTLRTSPELQGIRAAELTDDNVSLTSLTGLDLNISYTEGKAVVTTSAGVSATVVKSDVLFGLGSVVHVIDNVLT
ncbi:hypothetical protein QJQ45_014801 [Haematococcus lacustris]|nr:hypothetical protein QJQ45_014801 [Haematococcus lacustris]